MSTRRNWLTVLLLSLLATALFPPALMAVETVALQPYQRTITLNGLTYPRKEMTITSEVGGRCEKIYSDRGETVSPAGKLAEIDTTFIELDLKSNNIAMDEVRRKLDQEQKTFARYKVLINKESTPQATFDDVALNVDLLKLTLLKLQNEESRLHEQLKRHTLMAPPGWQVIERFAEPGEFIQPGTPIARLGDFRSLLTRLAVTYEELQSLEKQQDISLHLPEINQTVAATIFQTSPVFDPDTRKIPLELTIDAHRQDRTSPLRGGMRVELVFKSSADTNSFIVPASALINRYEAHWLVKPDGDRLRVILLGTSKDQANVIVSGAGLTAGMQVVSRPAGPTE